MRIYARNLVSGLQADRTQALADITEALEAGRTPGAVGGISPDSFSLRDLAAHTIFGRDGQPVGPSFVEEYLNPYGPHLFSEAAAAVDSTMFAGIAGQLIINKLMASYVAEDFILSGLIPNVPTRLNGERVPGVTMPGDPGEDVTDADEQEPLKYVGFTEEYVETPATRKKQLAIPITREAIFFDRTGLVLKQAGEVGTILGLQKEKRLIDVVIGYTNNYKEKRKGDSASASYKTFYSATDSGRWTNHFDGNALTDWTAIDYAEARFAEVTDPNTGEPVVVRGPVVLTTQSKRLTVQRLMTATQLAHGTQVTSAAYYPTVVTTGGNVLDQLNLMVHSSRQLRKRLIAQLGLSSADADGYWFYGDLARAFAYMENWPITVTQAPFNSEAEFERDIVVRFKASERGAAAVMDPRYWQRHRASSTSSSSGA